MPITKPSNFARSFGASIGYAGFGGAYIFVNTSSGRVSAILTKGSATVDQTKEKGTYWYIVASPPDFSMPPLTASATIDQGKVSFRKRARKFMFDSLVAR